MNGTVVVGCFGVRLVLYFAGSLCPLTLITSDFFPLGSAKLSSPLKIFIVSRCARVRETHTMNRRYQPYVAFALFGKIEVKFLALVLVLPRVVNCPVRGSYSGFSSSLCLGTGAASSC